MDTNRTNRIIEPTQDPKISSTSNEDRCPRLRPERMNITLLQRPTRPNSVPGTQTHIIIPSTSDLSTSKALILLLIIFTSSLLALGLLYRQFPDLEEQEGWHIKLILEL